MAITIDEYVDVPNRLKLLGYTNMGLSALLLPLNFDSANSPSELRHASEHATIKKLLRLESLPIADLSERAKLPSTKNKSAEWVAPILYISSALYSSNPELVSIALNVISSYVFQFFQGRGGERNVKLEVVIEKKNSVYKRVTYSGPVEGLPSLPNIIHKTFSDD